MKQKKNTKNDRVSCLSNVAAVSVILFKSFRLTRWWTIKLKFVSVKFVLFHFLAAIGGKINRFGIFTRQWVIMIGKIDFLFSEMSSVGIRRF